MTSYFAIPAASYVRGALGDRVTPAILSTTPLLDLTDLELEQLIAQGKQADLRMHRFKRTESLARMRRVLGILKGLKPADLLDVGSGRGTFLWPLLEAFPQLSVTATDLRQERTDFLQAVRQGGYSRLNAQPADASKMPFSDDAFDVVTAMEVLEHLQEPAAAAREIVRIARRAAVVSVPSKPDDNPEHIHFLDKDRLSNLFMIAGAENVRFDYILNHLIAVVRTCDG